MLGSGLELVLGLGLGLRLRLAVLVMLIKFRVSAMARDRVSVRVRVTSPLNKQLALSIAIFAWCVQWVIARLPDEMGWSVTCCSVM